MPAIFRILLLSLLLAPLAQAGNVALVLSESSGPYTEFSAAFSDALAGSSWKISSQGGIDTLAAPGNRPDLIVTVGSNAFRQVLAQGGSPPVLATLIPRQNYEKLLAEAPQRTRKISAIYLDQPPTRQAAFLRHLLPGKKRVGILSSPETQGSISQFRQVFTNVGLTLDSEDSDSDKSMLPALNTLLPRVNLLLAIPDPSIYRRDNIKAILVTTYRHQRPVIAFSAAFVSAGALAALYSTPAQIARQAAELTSTFTATLPSPQPPSQFAVAINSSVAQALDLTVPDEAAIRRAMLSDKEAR